jgi:hypothetical protein
MVLLLLLLVMMILLRTLFGVIGVHGRVRCLQPLGLVVVE